MENQTIRKMKQTAFRHFLERGYEATNIRDICSEVSIKPASLYFYFRSKQDLFFSVYDEIWKGNLNNIREVRELNARVEPEVMLFMIFRYTVSSYARDISAQKFLFRYHMFPAEEIAQRLHVRFRQMSEEEFGLISEVLQQCLDSGYLRGRGVREYFREYKRFETSQVTEMMISGIRKTPEELSSEWGRFWRYLSCPDGQ